MVRGLYTATAGMVSTSRRLDVNSNNIANASTPGFKKDNLITSTFASELTNRLEGNAQPVGNVSLLTVSDEVTIETSQGSLKETGRSLDMAIKGPGYFSFTSAQGQQLFSRNGQFTMDTEGYLTLPQGGRLMGQNGPIKLSSADFSVNQSGEILSNGKVVDKLMIYVPTGNTMVKHQEGMLVDTGFNAANFTETGSVLQGQLEMSNVDMTKEMTDMMMSSRNFQSCSQALKMIDQTLQKAANEVGRI